MNYKKYKWGFAFLFIPLIGVLLACKHTAVIPDKPEISFQADVQPIIMNNCATAGCHDGMSEQAELIYYYDIINYVTPSNAKKSDIYQRITTLKGESKMPITGHLSETQILTIYTWIMQGAKYN